MYYKEDQGGVILPCPHMDVHEQWNFSAVFTHGQGGGEGGEGRTPPLRVKNKSPPLSQKNGYPSQKILDPFYSIPLFLGFFYCACYYFHQTKKLQQLAND